MEEINTRKLFEYGYGCIPEDFKITCPICGTEISVACNCKSDCECGFKIDYNIVIIPYSFFKPTIRDELTELLGRFVSLNVVYDNVWFYECNGKVLLCNYAFKEVITIEEYKQIKSGCNDLESRLNQAKLIYKLYKKSIYDDSGNPSSEFYNFCDEHFKICKTTVKNLIGIYKRFVLDMELENYREYSYSQLVELLAFEYDDLSDVNPNMSVRALRELKSTKSKSEKSNSQTSDRLSRTSQKEDENDEKDYDDEEYITNDNRLTPIKVISVAEELKEELLNECKYKSGSSSYKAYELACGDFVNSLKTKIIDNEDENAEVEN